jgi:hypothetical protein
MIRLKRLHRRANAFSAKENRYHVTGFPLSPDFPSDRRGFQDLPAHWPYRRG